MQYSHCGCPIPGDSIGSKLVQLILRSGNAAPPSHLVPFDSPDLLSASHPSDHDAVHVQSKSNDAHKPALCEYESLARKREHDIQKAAKDNSGKVDKNRPVDLSTLDPPHLQTSRDQSCPFLVPVPMSLGGGENYVAKRESLIDSSGARGIGGFNGGGARGGNAFKVSNPSLNAGGGGGDGGKGGRHGGGGGHGGGGRRYGGGEGGVGVAGSGALFGGGPGGIGGGGGGVCGGGGGGGGGGVCGGGGGGGGGGMCGSF